LVSSLRSSRLRFGCFLYFSIFDFLVIALLKAGQRKDAEPPRRKKKQAEDWQQSAGG
jgi:hypothetical protein